MNHAVSATALAERRIGSTAWRRRSTVGAGEGSSSDDTTQCGRRTVLEDQQLFQSLRQALRSGEPLDLLAVVSGLLEVTDPRSRDPFARDEQRTSLADLVESFVGTPYAETTAALTAIAGAGRRRGAGSPDRPRAQPRGGTRCRTG